LWSSGKGVDRSNARNFTTSLALVVSSKQPYVIAAFYRREAAEALKACAALGKAPTKAVFLGLFGPSRRS